MNLVKMTQNSNDLGRTESKYKTGCFDNLQFDAVNNNLFSPHFFTRNSLVRKIKPVFIFCCCSNIKSERQTQSRPPRVTVATICSSAAENGEARSRSFSPCCWSSSSSFSSSSLLLVLQKEEAGQMDAKAPLGSSWWVRASWRLI